jgi:hypothetical protein
VALAYLVVGMSIGSWMLVERARDGGAPRPPWPTLHAHVLLIGFLLLVVMGVAFWMFPKVQGSRPGSGWGWAAFGLMNGGVILRVATEPAVTGGSRGPWSVGLAAAAVMPVLGAIAFAIAIWPRVRVAMSPEQARRLRAEVAPRPGRGED